MSNARPSVTKKQREQKKRERQAVKAEKRAQRKIDAHRERGPEEFVQDEFVPEQQEP